MLEVREKNYKDNGYYQGRNSVQRGCDGGRRETINGITVHIPQIQVIEGNHNTNRPTTILPLG